MTWLLRYLPHRPWRSGKGVVTRSFLAPTMETERPLLKTPNLSAVNPRVAATSCGL